MESSSLLRARVNRTHLRTAEKIFRTLGLKTGDAVNLFLAQVALRRDLPFTVTSRPGPLLSADQQAGAWTHSLGEYLAHPAPTGRKSKAKGVSPGNNAKNHPAL
jgi:addiction module RelB/DinJ family antitoxin